MDAQIRVSSGDEAEVLADLWEWLRHERSLAGQVRAVRRPPADGELGAVLELLVVAFGTGGAGAALAKSLAAWLPTCRPSVAVTVTTTSGTVTVNAQHLRQGDVIPLLQQVLPGDDA
jgi:Effector Associated Constant Component 1